MNFITVAKQFSLVTATIDVMLLLQLMLTVSYQIDRHFFFCEAGQNLPHYVMMCLVYTTWMSCRGVGNGLISVIRARGWRYLLLALIDVEACTLITSSHQFTSLASIQVYEYTRFFAVSAANVDEYIYYPTFLI